MPLETDHPRRVLHPHSMLKSPGIFPGRDSYRKHDPGLEMHPHERMVSCRGQVRESEQYPANGKAAFLSNNENMWAVSRYISCAGADTLGSRSWNVDREVVPLAVEIWRHLPERQATLLEYATVYV